MKLELVVDPNNGDCLISDPNNDCIITRIPDTSMLARSILRTAIERNNAFETGGVIHRQICASIARIQHAAGEMRAEIDDKLESEATR